MSLKQKTITGLFWSFIDSFANQGVQFVVGIVLARILSPREFGLIGMLTIFIAISQSFIDSGFSSALIRKNDCTNSDYSTVFYFNLAVGAVLYLILFVSAGAISSFFNEPQLKLLLQVLGVGLILSSMSIIQRTILTKNINFKLQTKVSIVASVSSGTIAITMALLNYGVWSLVALTLSRFGFTSLFLWIWTKWRPLWLFSKQSFKELFSFGSKLLLSGLIDTTYRNIYYLVIGKYFSAVELGYYTQADQFQALPSQNISGIMSRVTYPILAQMQDNREMLKAGFKRMIKSIMLISFVLMIGMAVIAKPLIITLIGEKWLSAIIYLQMLCFVGMFYPLHALNLNILNVLGRSDLFLKLEIIKKILAVPTIIIGVFFGIKVMIVGMMVNTLIAYFLNSYWSGRFINYPIKEQISDILPSLFLSIFTGVIVYVSGWWLPFSNLIILLCQITIGAFITLFTCEIMKIDSYKYLKNIIFTQLSAIKNEETR